MKMAGAGRRNGKPSAAELIGVNKPVMPVDVEGLLSPIGQPRPPRGVFAWMPTCCYNDMVVASWIFVWGSLGFVAVASLMLYIGCDATQSATPTCDLEEADAFQAYWLLMWLASFLFTVGSWVFVRGFGPPAPPLCGCASRHCKVT